MNPFLFPIESIGHDKFPCKYWRQYEKKHASSQITSFVVAVMTSRMSGRKGCRRVVNVDLHLNARENERSGGEHIVTWRGGCRCVMNARENEKLDWQKNKWGGETDVGAVDAS